MGCNPVPTGWARGGKGDVKGKREATGVRRGGWTLFVGNRGILLMPWLVLQFPLCHPRVLRIHPSARRYAPPAECNLSRQATHTTLNRPSRVPTIDAYENSLETPTRSTPFCTLPFNDAHGVGRTRGANVVRNDSSGETIREN